MSICFPTAHLQRKYINLDLAPGASRWLDFGDLALQRQSTLAEEHCFWTSAPNNAPDAHHEDDHYCIPDYFLVDTYAPNEGYFSLLPNPAQAYFRVTAPAATAATEWQLHDATGRLVQRGIYPAGQSELSVSTVQLPNGFYIFKMKNYAGKLIVKH